MNGRSEKSQPERLVEDAVAQFHAPHRKQAENSADAAGWEHDLTDFEWIALWVSIYSLELDSLDSETTIKH